MRMLGLITFLLVFSWALGLALFVHAMPQESTSATVKTDAIIVLTGGNARVERGFHLLAEGSAPVLMISGVGKNVTLAEMLVTHSTPAIAADIERRGGSVVLDHVARTTQSNAREAAQFVRERGYGSIRLITAHYHMPRSMAEMQRALPEVRIVPDAVFPAGFRRDQWMQHKTSRDLVLSEFHKYIAVKLRPWIRLK